MDFTRDMGERLLATGAQAFLAVFTLTDLGSAEAGMVAAGAAVLAMVKAWLASYVGTKGTASFAD